MDSSTDLATTYLSAASALAILSDQDYAESGEFLMRIAEEKKARKAYWEPEREKANALHKAITKKAKDALEPLERAEEAITRLRSEYRAKKERERVFAEQQAAALAQKKSDDMRLLYAEELEAQGLNADAQKVLNTPLPLSPVAVMQNAPTKTSGLVVRGSWVVTKIDPALIPDAFKVPDEKGIAGVVRARGDKHGIPGVTAEYRETEFGRKSK